jgi:hypothetical protein
MLAKYGVYDGEEVRIKMDSVKQEPRQCVQIYYNRLECLVVKGKPSMQKGGRDF